MLLLDILLVVILPRKSTVDRIDYSNDTATAVAKGPLTCNVNICMDQQQVMFIWIHWWWYSFYFISSVDRIDYSNDTATAASKGPLSAARVSISIKFQRKCKSTQRTW